MEYGFWLSAFTFARLSEKVMKANSFSIVIPTHNRNTLVASLLRTLSVARSNFSGLVEILVIDSSEGNEANAIRNSCLEHKAHYLRASNNICQKRNIGIQNASCEYVLFTDSDCEAMPDLLEQHAQTYEVAEEDVGGVLGLTRVTGDVALIWQILKFDSSLTAAFSFASWLQYAPWGTCTNLSFRKEVLEQIGGFDEDWPPAIFYGEDGDLGLRVNEAGFRIQCNPQAVVIHNSILVTSLRQVLRKKYLSGRATYYLAFKHPANVSSEFPGWVGMTGLLFLVLLLKGLIAHSLLPLLYLMVWLGVGVISQAILTARARRTGWLSILHHAAVILFEATFELGRLVELLHRGQVKGLWTKFVYVEGQLVGERDKRIRQMWASVLAFLCLVILLTTTLTSAS